MRITFTVPWGEWGGAVLHVRGRGMLGGLKLGSPFMVSVSFEIMQIDSPFPPS